MNKDKILKDLEAFKVGFANEGAAYLEGIYKTLPDEDKKPFFDWLGTVIQKGSLHHSIKLSIQYFLEEQHFTAPNVRRWVDTAIDRNEDYAQKTIAQIRADLELMPDKEGKTAYLIENRSHWFNEMKRKGRIHYDPTKGMDAIINFILFAKQRLGKLPTPPDCLVADWALPSEKVIWILSPALRAKRIVELINDLMQNIDKPPAVCSVIPDHLLEKIYPEIDCYLKGVTKKHFIECFKYKKRLEVKEGWNGYLIYLFRKIWRREGIQLNTLHPVFGDKYKYDKAPVEDKRIKMDAIYSNVKG